MYGFLNEQLNGAPYQFPTSLQTPPLVYTHYYSGSSECVAQSPPAQPQNPYQTHHVVRLERAVVDQTTNYRSNRYTRLPAIEFQVGDLRGIRLFDALQDNFTNLANPDIEVMEAVGDKVTYAIEWPGYPMFKKQVNARRKTGIQSRSRIAKQVAEIVEGFINSDKCINYISSQPEWKLGQGCMVFENLYLVEVKRISKATWAVGLAVAS